MKWDLSRVGLVFWHKRVARFNVVHMQYLTFAWINWATSCSIQWRRCYNHRRNSYLFFVDERCLLNPTKSTISDSCNSISGNITRTMIFFSSIKPNNNCWSASMKFKSISPMHNWFSMRHWRIFSGLNTRKWPRSSPNICISHRFEKQRNAKPHRWWSNWKIGIWTVNETISYLVFQAMRWSIAQADIFFCNIGVFRVKNDVRYFMCIDDGHRFQWRKNSLFWKTYFSENKSSNSLWWWIVAPKREETQ